MNIRCSNRCANPVRPGDSSLEPTWYHRSTATSGLERSTCRITVRPFFSTNLSKAIFSMGGPPGPRIVAGWSPRRTKIAAAVLLAAGFFARPGEARADGALPLSLGILLPEDRPQQVTLATNFGMLISDDAGASWLWTCEQPQTTSGYLYSLGPSPRDRTYALSPVWGFGYSDDGTCT